MLHIRIEPVGGMKIGARGMMWGWWWWYSYATPCSPGSPRGPGCPRGQHRTCSGRRGAPGRRQELQFRETGSRATVWQPVTKPRHIMTLILRNCLCVAT